MTTRKPRAKGHASSVLESLNVATTTVQFEPFATIFAQGDRCADIMYVDKGRVRLSVTSPDGRTAVAAVLHAGTVFGEGALAGQRRRKSTAEAITPCIVTLVATADIRRRLHQDVALSDWLRSQLLTRNVRIEQDIVNQIFNRIEKRLARALLLLAHFDEHQLPRYGLPKISRNLLAEMAGTTRSKVDTLMNDFRKRGFIERQTLANGGLQIHRSMMNVLLQS